MSTTDKQPAEPKGVLTKHRERMDNDPAYRDAALTPPKPIGNNPNITVKD